MSALPADRRFAGWSWVDTGALLLLAFSIVPAVTRNLSIDSQARSTVLALPGEPPSIGVRPDEAPLVELSRLVILLAMDTAEIPLESSMPGTARNADMGVDGTTPPQLVGIGVLPRSHIAILRFASGITRVVEEGEQWEYFTVEAIKRGMVTLRSPDTTYVLHQSDNLTGLR